MKWTKQGHIYAPDGTRSWAVTHAFPVTPFDLSPELLRLYVGMCDENTVSRIGYVDVLKANPKEIVAVAEEPVLDIGTPGAFDDNGVVPTCVLALPDRLLLYYVGFQLGTRVKYFQFQGLAESRDGGASFQRLRRAPVIDRTDGELLHRTSAFVMHETNRFKMWYVAGDTWITVGRKSLPRYNLRYLESSDGIDWPADGEVCLDFANDDEHAFGRPWIVSAKPGYRMFYSVRTKSKDYRLGYAESADGKNWERRDELIGIDVSAGGWDSEMIGYASVVTCSDNTYMFYNGNGRGKTGFGLAVLDD